MSGSSINKRLTVMVVVAALAVVASLCALLRVTTTTRSAPRADDRGEEAARRRPAAVRGGGEEERAELEAGIYPEGVMGGWIRHHLRFSELVGEDIPARYQESLAALRSSAPEAARALAEVYRRLPRVAYDLRYDVVETLGQLHEPSAESTLTGIARAPLGEETGDGHDFSTVEEETLIRVAAVVGLGELAGLGSDSARATLSELIDHQSLTVRREAIGGFLHASADRHAALAYVNSKVAPDERYLIDQPVTDRQTIEVSEELTRGGGKPPVF